MTDAQQQELVEKLCDLLDVVLTRLVELVRQLARPVDDDPSTN